MPNARTIPRAAGTPLCPNIYYKQDCYFVNSVNYTKMGNKTRVFVVIGPPRTGTSLVAGILHRSGIHMGDMLNPPADTNKTGFYEDFTIIDTNESILFRLGASWCRPPEYPLSDEVAQWYDGRVVAILLARHLSAQRDGLMGWGFKDQRMILLWPLYFQTLLDIGARLIVCQRNPLSVARSLVAAWPQYIGGVSEGLKLWADYTAIIEEMLNVWPTTSPPLRLNFEDVIADPGREICRLEEFTGCVMVRDVVDSGLRHF